MYSARSLACGLVVVWVASHAVADPCGCGDVKGPQNRTSLAHAAIDQAKTEIPAVSATRVGFLDRPVRMQASSVFKMKRRSHLGPPVTTPALTTAHTATVRWVFYKVG